MKKISEKTKTVKLTKEMLLAPENLLVAVGAVDSLKKQGFPSHVYLNPKDVFKMEKNIYKQLKKQYPNTHEVKLIQSVQMHMLDLGPNELKTVKQGQVLVDVGGIENEKAGARESA